MSFVERKGNDGTRFITTGLDSSELMSNRDRRDEIKRNERNIDRRRSVEDHRENERRHEEIHDRSRLDRDHRDRGKDRERERDKERERERNKEREKDNREREREKERIKEREKERIKERDNRERQKDREKERDNEKDLTRDFHRDKRPSDVSRSQTKTETKTESRPIESNIESSSRKRRLDDKISEAASLQNKKHRQGQRDVIESSTTAPTSKKEEVVEGEFVNPETKQPLEQPFGKSRWEDDQDEDVIPKRSRWEDEEEKKPKKGEKLEKIENNTTDLQLRSRWEDEEEQKPKKLEKNEKTEKIENIEPEKVESSPPKEDVMEIEPNTENIVVPEVKKPTIDSIVKRDILKDEGSLFLQAGLHTCRSVTNFEKICRIGDGAYGVVYKAKEKKLGEYVALKKVKMEKEKEGFPLTSIREIRILMSCKHPNIVAVKEIVVGKEIDSIFIAMEYVEHDLKTLMEDMPKPFTIAEVKCILNQLLLGVEYLHDNWILHRDIKTSNLLLNNNGIMKIADFGLARPYGSPLRPYTHVVVTLWYRAPELLLGTKTYTPAIDMWSVGCVFAELLQTKPLFRGKGEIDQLDQIFRILGSVDEDEWPAYRSLPNTKKFVNFPRKNSNNLRNIFSPTRLSDKGLDLLQQMLTYNPEQRITAKDALQHPYFEERPLQKDTELMPTWPSRADGRRPRNTDRIIDSPNPELEGEREKERETFIGQRDRNYASGFKMKPTGKLY